MIHGGQVSETLMIIEFEALSQYYLFQADHVKLVKY